MANEALAFWVREPGVGEIRPVALPTPAPARSSCARWPPGISRGTEALVFGGRVPASQHAAMRAPFQDGDFPGPVKYGYLNVGVVEEGPPSCCGTHGLLPAPAPDALRRAGRGGARGARRACRPARAVLAGTVETAVNALWDAAPLVGDRVTVVGAGMVGCCVARLLAPVPRGRGDARRRRPGRAPTSRPRLGRGLRAARTTRRPAATWSCTPARRSAGLQRSLDLLAPEGTVST